MMKHQWIWPTPEQKTEMRKEADRLRKSYPEIDIRSLFRGMIHLARAENIKLKNKGFCLFGEIL